MAENTAVGLLSRADLQSGPLGLARVLVATFAAFEGKREPPTPRKTVHVRLITIKSSHFCEKARWGLDLVENDETSPIYYTEDPHPPGFHAFASVYASNDQSSSTPCILIYTDSNIDTDDNPEFVGGSSTIQRRILPQLYPNDIADDVRSMEDYLDETLGPAVRCFLHYYNFMPQNESACARTVSCDTTIIEEWLFSLLFPVGMKEIIRESLDVSETNAIECKQKIIEVFDKISGQLARNHGKYIMDTPSHSNGFTAVDLTFAALSGLLLGPPELSLFLFPEPNNSEQIVITPHSSGDQKLPSSILSFRDSLRNTFAGQHGLRMYRDHRLPSNESLVRIKGVDRNRFFCTPCR